MTCTEALISTVIGVMTGLISGLIVTAYFRYRDKKAEKERMKERIFEIWYDHMVKYIDMIEPIGDSDMKFLTDTWDIAHYDSELMNELLQALDELRQVANPNEHKRKVSAREKAAIDRAYNALDSLNKLKFKKTKFMWKRRNRNLKK